MRRPCPGAAAAATTPTRARRWRRCPATAAPAGRTRHRAPTPAPRHGTTTRPAPWSAYGAPGRCHAAGGGDRRQQRGRFVAAFQVFEIGVAVDDDAGAGLDAGPAVGGHHHGPD